MSLCFKNWTNVFNIISAASRGLEIEESCAQVEKTADWGMWKENISMFASTNNFLLESSSMESVILCL